MLKDQVNGIILKDGSFQKEYTMYQGIEIVLKIFDKGHTIPYFTSENTSSEVFDAIPLRPDAHADWKIVDDYLVFLKELRFGRAGNDKSSFEVAKRQGNFLELQVESHGDRFVKGMEGEPVMYITTHLSHSKYILQLDRQGKNLYSASLHFPVREEFKDVITPGMIRWT